MAADVAQGIKTKDFLRHLGLLVRRLRQQSGLTQGALAAAIGRTQPTVARLERGSLNNISLDLVILLASQFSMHPGHFLILVDVSNSAVLPSADGATHQMQRILQCVEKWDSPHQQWFLHVCQSLLDDPAAPHRRSRDSVPKVPT